MFKQMFQIIAISVVVITVGIFADPRFNDIRIGDILIGGGVLYFIIAMSILLFKHQSMFEYINSIRIHKIENEILRNKSLFNNEVITEIELDERIKKLQNDLNNLS